MGRVTHILGLLLLLASSSARPQRFYPDDPISKDPDNISIKMPARVSLSRSYDLLQNSLGLSNNSELVHAQNVNTLGEVPDSSWFTNRIGVRNLTREELLRGGDRTGGPDTTSVVTVVGAGLLSVTQGIVVRDSRGDSYYLNFDPAGMAGMATGAAVVADKFFYAAGYNVLPASISVFDPAKATISSDAQIDLVGYKHAPLDQEFLNLFLQDKQRQKNGTYRVVAYYLPPGESVGEFMFHGTRSDDPNDVIPHENRRELRGMGVFAAWLNHYNYRSINTLDRYETTDGRSYIRHYLNDFSTALGSGYDLDGRIVPKAKWSGNEYTLFGDLGATLKTAGTFGFWKRPWLKVSYPQYPEVGRFEAEFFEPEEWRPAYPNAAFIRMLPDDAFWAAKIVARFSDDDIRAIVKTGEYSDPAAEKYLADTLIKRRGKIIAAYFKPINPLDGFVVVNGHLRFRNPGQEAKLAKDVYYEYVINTYNNQKDELSPVTDSTFTYATDIPLPKVSADYLMIRVRTRSAEQRAWRKNVDVYIRNTGTPVVVGIDREVGAYVLDRDLNGQVVARSKTEFGGTYQSLTDDEKRIVDDWVRRYDQMTNREVTSEATYNNLPFSTRTTFEALMNALTETGLTDESGKDLGIVLDLVSRLDSIRGHIDGVGGDQQFRIYVELVPGAVKILESSQQFEREKDNTVFHRGYPHSYRLKGGPPSVQISTTEDGMRADIDVDYRSSEFPAALLDGHLTAANSDVRAGSNYALHANRWEGLDNWWRGLFGLPFVAVIAGTSESQATVIPITPRKATGSLEEAMEDWLKAFLIEQKPEQALAYFAQSSYACMDVWSDERPIDYGIAPAMLLDRMVAANKAIGKVDNLNKAVQGETLGNPRLKVMPQKNTNPFVLYEVPEDVALQFDCANRNSPKVSGTTRTDSTYGKYFGSAFRLKDPNGRGGGKVLFLWAKENKKWRVLSYMVDPGVRELGDVPDTRPEQSVTLQRMPADPAFLTAVEEFFTLWRTGKVDAALDRFAPQSLPCVALSVKENLPEGDAAARSRLRLGLDRIYQAFTQAKDEADFVEPVQFTHPAIRIVDHEHADRFTLAGIPDHMGSNYDCNTPIGKVTFQTPATPVYGNYYASALRFHLVSEDSAALYLVWSRVGAVWKIVSFYVVAA